MDWDGLAATYRQVVFLLLFFFLVQMRILKTAYQRVHSAEGLSLLLSVSLHLSHISTPQREKQASVCLHFLSHIQPSSPRLLLLTVLFEQLQQGNVSTAFQAQAYCVAMSQSSTRHSAVLIHRQAPHSMLQRQNINVILVANKNMTIYLNQFHIAFQWISIRKTTMACYGGGRVSTYCFQALYCLFCQMGGFQTIVNSS